MGKISDKFLSMLRLDPDEDYDDDDYFDEPDEEEPIYTKRSTSKSRKFIDDDEDDIALTREPVRENVRTVSSASRTISNNRGKVVPMRKGRNVGSNMEVCIIRPTTMNDCPDVTDTLLSGRAVILNLEGLPTDTAQRIIDFTSGSCYAINGNLQKITSYIFIITPENVEISGDFQEMLGSGMDVTGRTSGF